MGVKMTRSATNDEKKGIKRDASKSYPETPMTIVGCFVPLLIMHQFSEELLSSFSSKYSCFKMLNSFNLIRFITGRITPLAGYETILIVEIQKIFFFPSKTDGQFNLTTCLKTCYCLAFIFFCFPN